LALRRIGGIGGIGNGWCGNNANLESARQHGTMMNIIATAAGRDAPVLSFTVSPLGAVYGALVGPADVEQYAEAGIDQLIVGAVEDNAEQYEKLIEAAEEVLIVPLENV